MSQKARVTNFCHHWTNSVKPLFATSHGRGVVPSLWKWKWDFSATSFMLTSVWLFCRYLIFYTEFKLIGSIFFNPSSCLKEFFSPLPFNIARSSTLMIALVLTAHLHYVVGFKHNLMGRCFQPLRNTSESPLERR